jgi:hypothetical protein
VTSPLLVLLQGDPFPNRIAIVDLHGNEVASTSFAYGKPPLICGAGYLQPPVVRVVGHLVYFVDGTGTIRDLDLSGKLNEITQLPLTSSQQQPYFAVSPDGNALLANVVKLRGVNPNSSSPGDCAGPDSSQGIEDYSASPGSSPRDLGPGDFGTFSPTVVAGWDKSGPLGTTQTAIGFQNPGSTFRFAGEYLVRVDPNSGAATGAPLGGSDCRPVDFTDNGTVLCYLQSGALSVRASNGNVIWSVNAPAGTTWWPTPLLSVGAQRIALGTRIISRDGSSVSMPGFNPAPSAAGVEPRAWLDDETLVVADANKESQLYLLQAPYSTSEAFLTQGRLAGVIYP